MSDGVVIWDFDGTLAHRPKGWWSSSLLEWIEEVDPGNGLTFEMLAPHLRRGFPWHEHEHPHHELSEPDAWWDHFHGILRNALIAAGIDQAIAAKVSGMCRSRFPSAEHWELYEDVRPALQSLSDRGWRHMILSNHIPELPEICTGLGLGELVDQVFTSALIGYEKPHAEAFKTVLAHIGKAEIIWMVGDNPVADVAGAEKLGIPGILVRTDTSDEKYLNYLGESFGRGSWSDWGDHLKRTAKDLNEAADLIGDGPRRNLRRLD